MLTALLHVFLAFADGSSKPSYGIVNGDVVTSPSSYPFVSMTWLPASSPTYPDNPAWDNTFCTGSLVAARWVLTAAHCQQSDAHVSVHRSNYSKPTKAEGGVDRKVVASFVNPKYAHETDSQYDMMLLQLDAPVPASVATPIALDDGTFPLQGPATVLGFGSSDLACKTYCTSELGCPMRKGHVTIPDDATCRTVDSKYDPKHNVCAAGNTSAGAGAVDLGAGGGGWVRTGCGDSGGPLIVERNGTLVQVGIVSWGYSAPRSWDMYVRPAGSIEWIRETIALGNAS